MVLPIKLLPNNVLATPIKEAYVPVESEVNTPQNLQDIIDSQLAPEEPNEPINLGKVLYERGYSKDEVTLALDSMGYGKNNNNALANEYKQGILDNYDQAKLDYAREGDIEEPIVLNGPDTVLPVNFKKSPEGYSDPNYKPLDRTPHVPNREEFFKQLPSALAQSLLSQVNPQYFSEENLNKKEPLELDDRMKWIIDQGKKAAKRKDELIGPAVTEDDIVKLPEPLDYSTESLTENYPFEPFVEGEVVSNNNQAFKDILGHRESTNNYQAENRLGYLGKYQFGGQALIDVGLKDSKGNWTGKNGVNSKEDFLNNTQAQEQAMDEYLEIQKGYLKANGAWDYIGTEFQGIPITENGLLMAAHLVGNGAINKMLRTGNIEYDGNNTPATEYLKLGNTASPTTTTNQLVNDPYGITENTPSFTQNGVPILSEVSNTKVKTLDQAKREKIQDLGLTPLYSEQDFQKETALATNLGYQQYLTSSSGSKLNLDQKREFFNSLSTGDIQEARKNFYRFTQTVTGNRSIGRWTGDALLDVAKGATSLASIPPGIGAILTGGKVGTDSMAYLSAAREYLSELQSEYKQESWAEVQERYQEAYEINKQRLATQDDVGFLDHALALVQETGVALSASGDNPTVILSTVLEEVVPFMLGGTLMKGAANITMNRILKARHKKLLDRATKGKDLTKEELDKITQETLSRSAKVVLNSNLAKKATDRAMIATGLSFGSLQEGMAIAGELTANFVKKSEAELYRDSEQYRELRKQGFNHIEARNKVAEDLLFKTAITATATSAAVLKLSKAVDTQKALITGRKKGVTETAVKTGFSHAGEEAAQGGITTGVAQKVAQVSADQSVETTEGLGLEIGLGAIAGGTIGVGASILASPASQEAVIKATETITEKAGKTAELLGLDKEVRKAIKEGRINELLDTTREDFNIKHALQALMHSSSIPKKNADESDEEFSQRVHKYQENLLFYSSFANDLAEFGPDETTTQKQLDEGVKLAEEAMALAQQLEKIKRDSQSIEADLEIIRDKQATEEKRREAKERVLGSMQMHSASTEQVEEIINDTENFTDKERKLAESYKDLTDAMTTALKDKAEETGTKDLDIVHSEVLQGGKGKIGIAQYSALFNAAMARGDKEGARKVLKAFRQFANRHNEKATALIQLYRKFKQGNATQAEIDEAAKKYKFRVGENSGKVIDAMESELLALRQADNYFVSQGVNKFGKAADVTPSDTPLIQNSGITAIVESRKAKQKTARKTQQRQQQQKSRSVLDIGFTETVNNKETPVTGQKLNKVLKYINEIINAAVDNPTIAKDLEQRIFNYLNKQGIRVKNEKLLKDYITYRKSNRKKENVTTQSQVDEQQNKEMAEAITRVEKEGFVKDTEQNFVDEDTYTKVDQAGNRVTLVINTSNGKARVVSVNNDSQITFSQKYDSIQEALDVGKNIKFSNEPSGSTEQQTIITDVLTDTENTPKSLIDVHTEIQDLNNRFTTKPSLTLAGWLLNKLEEAREEINKALQDGKITKEQRNALSSNLKTIQDSVNNAGYELDYSKDRINTQTISVNGEDRIQFRSVPETDAKGRNKWQRYEKDSEGNWKPVRKPVQVETVKRELNKLKKEEDGDVTLKGTSTGQKEFEVVKIQKTNEDKIKEANKAIGIDNELLSKLSERVELNSDSYKRSDNLFVSFETVSQEQAKKNRKEFRKAFNRAIAAGALVILGSSKEDKEAKDKKWAVKQLQEAGYTETETDKWVLEPKIKIAQPSVKLDETLLKRRPHLFYAYDDSQPLDSSIADRDNVAPIRLKALVQAIAAGDKAAIKAARQAVSEDIKALVDKGINTAFDPNFGSTLAGISPDTYASIMDELGNTSKATLPPTLAAGTARLSSFNPKERPTIEVPDTPVTLDEIKADPTKNYVLDSSGINVSEVNAIPNALGFPLTGTKENPLTDRTFAANTKAIDGFIDALKKSTLPIVFPRKGFLKEWKDTSPETIEYLEQKLKDELGFNNLIGTVTPARLSQVESPFVVTPDIQDLTKAPKGSIVNPFTGTVITSSGRIYADDVLISDVPVDVNEGLPDESVPRVRDIREFGLDITDSERFEDTEEGIKEAKKFAAKAVRRVFTNRTVPKGPEGESVLQDVREKAIGALTDIIDSNVVNSKEAGKEPDLLVKGKINRVAAQFGKGFLRVAVPSSLAGDLAISRTSTRGRQLDPELNLKNEAIGIGIARKVGAFFDTKDTNLGRNILSGTIEGNALAGLFNATGANEGAINNDLNAFKTLENESDINDYGGFIEFHKEFEKAFYDLLSVPGQYDSQGRNNRNPAWNILPYLFKGIADFPDASLNTLEEKRALLDPNTVTALATVAYEWFGSKGEDTLHNTKEDINVILSRDTKIQTNSREVEHLSDVGISLDKLSEDIGRRSLTKLGLKQKVDQEGFLNTKLENEIGAMIVGSLIEMGYLENTFVPTKLLVEFSNRDRGNNYIHNIDLPPLEFDPNSYKGGYINYVRAVGSPKSDYQRYDKPLEMGEKGSKLLRDFKTKEFGGYRPADNVIEELFGVDDVDNQLPKFKPVTKAPAKLNNTNQNTSKEVKEAIVEHNKQPKKINYPLYQLIRKFDWNNESDRDRLLAIAGGETDSDILDMHVNRAISEQAKKAGLTLEYKNFFEFLEHMRNSNKNVRSDEFYFSYNPWKHYRTGQNEKINPQQSKIHRALTMESAFENKITRESERKLFKLALAQSWGVKVDQLNVSESLEQFEKLVSSEGVDNEGNPVSSPVNDALLAFYLLDNPDALAVEAEANKVSEDTLIHDLKDLLVKAVSDLGEGMHSLQGLYEYYKNKEALNKGRDFTTNIYFETDGITNGTAFGLMLLGNLADPTDTTSETSLTVMLNRVGIFINEKDSGNEPAFTDVGDYTSKGGKDSYTVTGDGLVIEVNLIEDAYRNLNNISTQDFMGDLRNPMWHFMQNASNSRKGQELIQKYKSKNKYFSPYPKKKEGEEYRKTLVNHYNKHQNVKAFWDEIRKDLIPNILVKVGETFGPVLTNEKLARLLAKDPVMIGNYGAGDTSIKGSFVREAIQKLLDQITESVVKQERGNYDALISILEHLTFSHKTKDMSREVYNPNTRKKDKIFHKALHRQFPFNNKNVTQKAQLNQHQLEMLAINFSGSYGDALTTSMRKKFGGMREVASKLNESYRDAFYAFQTIYQDREAALKQEYGVRQLSPEASQKLQKELAEFAPIYIGPNAETYDEGLNLIKFTRTRANPDINTQAGYQSKTIFNKAVGKNANPKTKKVGLNSIETNGEFYVMQDPGVSAVPLIVQNADSAVQYRHTIGKLPAVNLHDATLKSISHALQTDTKLNKDFWDITFEVNPQDQLRSLFTRLGSELTDTQREIFETVTEKSFEEAFTEVNSLSSSITNHKDTLKNNHIVYVQNYSDQLTGPWVHIPEDSTVPTSQEDIDSKLANLANNVISDAKGHASSADPLNIDNMRRDEEYKVNRENIEEVFLALEGKSKVRDSVAHQEQLNKVVHLIKSKLNDPLKVFIDNTDSITRGVIVSNNIHINNSISRNPFALEMSLQEVFAHEGTHAITKYGIDTNAIPVRELRRLFNSVEKAIQKKYENQGWKLFLDNVTTPTAEEIQAAKDRYNYIFNNKDSTNGLNNYLHEFAAYGLTNEKLINELKTINSKSTSVFEVKGNNFYEKLVSFFENVMNYISELITGTSNSEMRADKKLQKLISEIANLQQKNEDILDKLSTTQNKLYNHANRALVKFIVKPIWQFTTGRTAQKLYRGIPFGVGDVLGNIAETVQVTGEAQLQGKGEEHRNEWRKVINEVNRRVTGSINNLGTRLLNELAGTNKDNRGYIKLHREANKVIDQATKEVAEHTAKHILESFRVDQPNKEQDKALNKIVLEGDLSALLDKYSWKDIIELVKPNSSKLRQEITSLKNIIQRDYPQHSTYYLKSARSLAQFLVTGEFIEVDAAINAHLIATLQNTGRTKLTNVQGAERDIDRLVTLTALSLQDSNQRKHLHDLMVKEFEVKSNGNLGNEDNGVSFLMQIHQDNKKQALDKLFDNDPKLVIKGYTKELFNPDHDMRIVTDADVDFYKSMGYEVDSIIDRDPLDKEGLKYRNLMVIKSGGLPTYMAGIVSLQDLKFRGETVRTLMLDPAGERPEAATAYTREEITRLRKRQIEGMFSAGNTSTSRPVFVPVYTARDDSVTYRYIMTEKQKKRVLDKTHNFSKVMGNMEASVLRKIKSPEINAKAVQAMYDDYEANFTKEPNQFVVIGESSTDPELQEIYRLMPQNMKDSIKRIWGKTELRVRADTIPIIFGQRKFALAQYFAGKREVNKNLDQQVNPILELIWKIGSKGQVRKGERIWKEIVSYAKDAIVIKGIDVLLGNVMSNNILLWNMGVGVKDIVKYQIEAVRALDNWKEDEEQLHKLQRQLRVKTNSQVNKDRLKVLIARIEDRMAVNPVKELIDEGLFQTIVEDISLVEREDEYRGPVGEMVDNIEKTIVPPVLMPALNNIFASRESAVHHFLNKATQMSDFVARYALHQHNLKKGMDREESIQQASDVFINYDLPSHNGVQWLNDIGLLMFTNFYLGIQNIITYVLIHEPARFVSLMSALDAFGHLSNIFDSFLIGNLPGQGFMAPWTVAWAAIRNNPVSFFFF